MSLTPSNTIEPGKKAPEFKLMDTITDHLITLEEIRGDRGTMIMFICNHCPFVKHVNEEIVHIANEYRQLGFGFAGIMSNDIKKYPEDAPEKMKEHATKNQYSFPYLFDGTQEVAKAYDAACTPDFYLFDSDLKLIYHGQMDDSRPGNGIHPNGRDLREAMDAVINNRIVSAIQKPSIGCNIKWKE